MQNIKEQADMASVFALTNNSTFSEGVEKAKEIIAAREMFIESFMPAVGKIVKCVNTMESMNGYSESGYQGAKELSIGRKYKVVDEDSDGLIFLEDLVTGMKLGRPFFKLRFEAVI